MKLSVYYDDTDEKQMNKSKNITDVLLWLLVGIMLLFVFWYWCVGGEFFEYRRFNSEINSLPDAYEAELASKVIASVKDKLLTSGTVRCIRTEKISRLKSNPEYLVIARTDELFLELKADDAFDSLSDQDISDKLQSVRRRMDYEAAGIRKEHAPHYEDGWSSFGELFSNRKEELILSWKYNVRISTSKHTYEYVEMEQFKKDELLVKTPKAIRAENQEFWNKVEFYKRKVANQRKESGKNTGGRYTESYYTGKTSKQKADPYDVNNYSDAEDFADEWEDEFEDWDDAFMYYEDHHK